MKKAGKSKKWVRILIISIVALIFLFAIYMGITGYVTMVQNPAENELIFQQGLQIGYTEAVLQIMNLSLSCQPVPVYAGNATIELIAVDCLR